MLPSTLLRPTVSVLLSLTLAGCGFAHVNTDRSTRPDRALGTGAAVIMPGQAPPPLESYDPYGASGNAPEGASSSSSSNSNTPPPGRTSRTQAPPARTGNVPLGGGGTQTYGSGPGRQSGSASGPEASRGRIDPEMTMIGGHTGQSDEEYTLRDAPLGPLAILFGYPWWVLGKTLPETADQEVEERQLPDARPDLPTPTHPADARQRVLQDRENAELERLLAQSNPPQPAYATSRGSAIGDELAALERSLGRGQASSVTGRRETADRNADGRPDLWSQVNADGTSRESIDDDHDGRAERILHYDAEHRLTRSEEDLDGDGRFETQAQYAGGEVVRRRADMNGDGQIDTWTYYRAGAVIRLEVDRDGDGFRDLSSVYSAGELVREEEDTNGDGNADRVSYYRAGEIVERTEDTDFDGDTDIRSYYSDGKLVKREVG